MTWSCCTPESYESLGRHIHTRVRAPQIVNESSVWNSPSETENSIFRDLVVNRSGQCTEKRRPEGIIFKAGQGNNFQS